MIEAEDIARVLVPTLITPAMITAMTANGVAVPEDPSPAWTINSTYALGARVHSATTHRVYESLKDGNNGKDPTVASNRTTAAGVGTWWIDISPTNKYAAFDGLISTPLTVAASPLVITLRPGAFNALALLGVDADSITVTARDAPGGAVIYQYNAPLEGSQPADYYEYFFEPFKPQTQFIATDVEPYGAAEITLTLTKATGSIKLGMFAIGDARPLGAPERGTKVSPKTYSYIAEDAYGNTMIKKRPRATNLSLPIKVALEDVDSVLDTLQELLDVPAVVIGSTAQYHTKLTTFGLISGEMDYSTYPDRTLNLTVKGMI